MMVGTFHYFLISSLHIIFWRTRVTARHIILYYTDLVYTPSRGYKNKILSNRSSDRILYHVIYCCTLQQRRRHGIFRCRILKSIVCSTYIILYIYLLPTSHRRGVSNFQDCDWWRAHFFNREICSKLIDWYDVSSKIHAARNN